MKQDLSYQRIVDYLRRRHNLSRGDGWPGLPVGSPAVSRYPNIAQSWRQADIGQRLMPNLPGYLRKLWPP